MGPKLANNRAQPKNHTHAERPNQDQNPSHASINPETPEPIIPKSSEPQEIKRYESDPRHSYKKRSHMSAKPNHKGTFRNRNHTISRDIISEDKTANSIQLLQVNLAPTITLGNTTRARGVKLRIRE